MVFCYIHTHSKKTTYVMDLVNIPRCGKNFDTLFFINFLGNNMLHRPPRRPPRPGSLLMLLYFLFTCSIFLLILPFVFIITEISHHMAMRKSIHDVVDVQSLWSRHQMSMLHYWIFCRRVTVHAALRNSHTALSIWHAAPSNYWYYVALSNRYAVLNH